MLPFKESKITSNIVERYFEESTNDIELTWHRDSETRLISSLSKTNWKIQLDNELPQLINKEILIEDGRWHRLIKGTGDLIIRIIKLDENHLKK